MRLSSAVIQRYRSVKNAEIGSIGNFNVLIGRNNAGKSTLLDGIRAFFLCIKDGNIVSLDPPIGKSLIDFSQRNNAAPIELSLRFSVLPEERQKLVESIASEAQLKNAVESLEQSLFLSVTIRIVGRGESYAYVARVALNKDPKLSSISTDRVLLNVSEVASVELAKKYRDMSGLSGRFGALEKAQTSVDEDDFRQMRRELGETRGIGRYWTGRRIFGEPTPDSLELLEALIRNSSSLGDFQAAARVQADSVMEQLKSLRSQPLVSAVETFAGSQLSVPRYVLSLLKNLSAMEVLYLTEQRKRVGREEAERLLQLKMQRGGDRTLENIKQTVQSLLGVKIDAFASSSGGYPGRSSAEMDVDDFLLEVNGSGIREALRLILDVEFQKPKLLLVEEPEVHLHPALETSMMKFLKAFSQNCQVFISTHSTNFLDAAETSNVYLISKLVGETSVEQLTLEDAEAVLPKELGLRLSSLFMFDRLVFVEGPTDEAVIREWANTLGANLGHANVGFISIGGVRNFGHYATENIFEFLSKRQVKCWFILDRDERGETEINAIRARLAGKATVVVLDKRELENFLIGSNVIAKFIELKLRMAGKPASQDLSAENVQTAIMECAETLKQGVIDKRVAHALCTTIHPEIDWEQNPETPIAVRISTTLENMKSQVENNHSQIGAVIQQQTDWVAQVWNEKKLDLVQGDLLLDCVCQKFGTRYKKSNDAARIARLMEKHEIGLQIKSTVEMITAIF